MSRIFISYRRSDSPSEAGRIYDYLDAQFGRDFIFKDVDDIDMGDDFRQSINAAVGQCQILLAVIGKSWLTAEDAAGNRRLDNPADWVRLEIETALKRNVRVIPVLVQDVEMPQVSDLPESLQPMAYRNVARVRYDPDFRRDMDRIAGVIQRHLQALGKIEPETGSADFEDIEWESNSKRADPEKPNSKSSESPPSEKYAPNFRRDMSRVAGVIQRHLQALEKSESETESAGFEDIEWESNFKGADPEKANSKSSESLPSERDTVSTFEFDVVTIDDVRQKLLGLGKPEIETRRYQATAACRRELLTDDIGLELVRVPSGEGVIGSKRNGDNSIRQISMKSFWIGKYPVTQAQWKAVSAFSKVERDLPDKPSHFEGDNRPVECVSWDDANEFCQRISKRTGRRYRLPSEAEWEYACRAGTTTSFHFGETLASNLANYHASYIFSSEIEGEYKGETTDVGLFPANGFGLYDMHGNVWEWCLNGYCEDREYALTSNSGWLHSSEEKKYAVRGGSWIDSLTNCRSAHRYLLVHEYRCYYVGFRVVCSAHTTL